MLSGTAVTLGPGSPHLLRQNAASARPQVVHAVARRQAKSATDPAPTAAAAATQTSATVTPPHQSAFEAETFDMPHTFHALHLMPVGPWAEVPGGVTAPLGYAAQGVHAGLRSNSHRADVAIVLSDSPAASAGRLSSNPLASASVGHTREALYHSGQARAVLMHHGQANIGTGHEGLLDAHRAAAAAAAAISGIMPAGGSSSPDHLHPEHVLLQSAGQLGERPCLDRMLPALPGLVAGLEAGAEGAYHAACAMTSADTTTKEAALEVPLDRHSSVRLGGMAHASPSGIQAVITCDAAVDGELWRALVEHAAAASFGLVALCSGDCLNDSVVALANGAAGNPPILEPTSAAAHRLEAALTALMQGLAKGVAWDGPAASCLVEVEVSGAECLDSARQVALAVARSPRVRADISRCCPDWSAVLCALGSSGVAFWPSDLVISLGSMPLFHHGKPAPDFASAAAYAAEVLHLASARRSQVTLGIKLGPGPCSAKAWTFDAAWAGEPCCVF